MPIPILLAGLGVAAGALGAGGHLSAKETNERAQKISQDAQNLYNSAKHSLEQEQNRTEQALLQLGYAKKNILDTSMRQFVGSYDKIKHIQVTESIGINEISNFMIDQQDVIEIRRMADIYSGSIASGATGAAAGAVVALAASGSLSVVTGGLAAAGSVLAAGEVGAAAGIAGSALSFGAAMTPLAAVAAPVILFTGISASIKADENLEKANAMYAEAKAASEKMKVSETLCGAITDKSEMFYGLLGNLNGMFSECSALLAGIVKKKEGRVFKKKLMSENFTEEELRLIAVTRALAGAVKSVIDMPVLSKEGTIATESENVYSQTMEKLPDFGREVRKVKQTNYTAKPIAAKPMKEGPMAASQANVSGITVLGGARNVLAVVFGCIFATAFAGSIAHNITEGPGRFLFLQSITVNKIALWIILCASVMMVVGNFQKSKIEMACNIGTGTGIGILYVQYCRTVEWMEHYIIFSVIALLVLGALWSFMDGKKNIWKPMPYFIHMLIGIAFWPVLFLGYAFFSKLLWFSEGFCLVVTAFFSLIISLGAMCGDSQAGRRV